MFEWAKDNPVQAKAIGVELFAGAQIFGLITLNSAQNAWAIGFIGLMFGGTAAQRQREKRNGHAGVTPSD